MDYKKQCISHQLISANSLIPEGFIVHVLIEMIDPSELLWKNVLVIPRVACFTERDKKLLIRKRVSWAKFSRWCSVCQVDGACFQRAWGRAENTAPSQQPHSRGLQAVGCLSVLPWEHTSWCGHVDTPSAVHTHCFLLLGRPTVVLSPPLFPLPLLCRFTCVCREPI